MSLGCLLVLVYLILKECGKRKPTSHTLSRLEEIVAVLLLADKKIVVSYDTEYRKASEDAFMNNPTTQTYTSLSTAYDFFNRELFCGSLPPCLITMQRHKGAYGYFSGERFASLADPKEITDEIALNPNHFATRTATQVLSTLAHEMCHLWQHHFGKRPRAGYHNRQWAAKMHEIGLIPTDTGKLGGKETGQVVSHVIEENGRFACAVAKLLAEHPAILYSDRSENNATRMKRAADKVASKTKYICPGCRLHAWAKRKVLLVCGACQKPMRA